MTNHRIIKSKSNLFSTVALDWEFITKLRLAIYDFSQPHTITDYHKCEGVTTPILGGFLFEGESETVVVEHPQVKVVKPDFVSPIESWTGETVFSHLLGLTEVDEPLSNKKLPTLTITILFFYSPSDILNNFKSKEKKQYIQSMLVKHRTLKTKTNTSGGDLFGKSIPTKIYVEYENKIYHIMLDLEDQTGHAQGGLDSVAGSFGYEMTFKKLMDDWKDSMLIPYTSTFPTCPIKWSTRLEDGTIELLDEGDIYNDAVVDKENGQILHDLFVEYTKGDVPVLYFLKEKSYQNSVDMWDKLGLDFHPKRCATVGGYGNQYNMVSILKGLGVKPKEKCEINELPIETLQKIQSYLLPGSECNLKAIGGSAVTLATLDGGYCKNLIPRVAVIQDTVIPDLDLSGCYVEGMKNQIYPVGRPVVIDYTNIDEKKTLKEILKKHECQFVPGCWVARVSTVKPLSFDQDLIISKIFNENNFAVWGEDEDGFEEMVEGYATRGKTSGRFQLLTREIHTGIITHDILQAMKLYSTPSELREYMAMEVDALLYYPKSGRMKPSKFVRDYKPEQVVNHKVSRNGTKLTRETQATYFWTGIPMGNGWVTNLGDARNETKRQMKDFIKTQSVVISDEQNISLEAAQVIAKKHPDYIKLNSLQYGYKIAGLSLFGTTGSIHYQTEEPKNKDGKPNPKSGNYCVANNITARARVAVWAVSKAMMTQMVITDGGALDLNNVAMWDWKGVNSTSVGFQTLCDLTNFDLSSQQLTLNGNLNIGYQPLGGKEWKTIKLENNIRTISNGDHTIAASAEGWGELDALMYAHVKKLFIKLDIFKYDQYKFATKDVYQGLAIQSQANYLLDYDGNPANYKIAARGYELKKGVYATPECEGVDSLNKSFPHPFKNQFVEIYNKKLVTACNRVYTPNILGVNDVNKSKEVSDNFYNRNMFAGDVTMKTSHARPISLTSFRWQTYEQLMSWSKKHEKMRDDTGWGIENYFAVERKNETINGVDVEVSLTVDYHKAMVAIQNAIDEGYMWITSDKRIYNANLPYYYHPQKIADLKITKYIPHKGIITK